MKNTNSKETNKPELSQIRVYSRLMPDLKALAAVNGWSLVEAASVLIAEALNGRQARKQK